MTSRTASQRYEDSRNEPPPCKRCGGTGEVPAVSATDQTEWRTCPKCAGLGVENMRAKEGK